MPLPQKPQAARTLVLASGYPEALPKLPEDALKRFPSLYDWQTNVDRWWYESRKSLVRDITEIIDNINAEKRDSDTFEASINSQIDSINTQIAGIDARVTVLEGGSSTTDDLSSDIAEVAGDLAAHIADKSTHGVSGDVVGTTDPQSLESKSIGFTSPGYGRFKTCISSNIIYISESVVVPVDYNWVVAGLFTVYGSLTIEGTMHFL